MSERGLACICIARTMLTKSHPFKKVNRAITTHAIGERKKDRSSFWKRMEKGRMGDGAEGPGKKWEGER
jgi:hypothetical protein